MGDPQSVEPLARMLVVSADGCAEDDREAILNETIPFSRQISRDKMDEESSFADSTSEGGASVGPVTAKRGHHIDDETVPFSRQISRDEGDESSFGDSCSEVGFKASLSEAGSAFSDVA